MTGFGLATFTAIIQRPDLGPEGAAEAARRAWAGMAPGQRAWWQERANELAAIFPRPQDRSNLH